MNDKQKKIIAKTWLVFFVLLMTTLFIVGVLITKGVIAVDNSTTVGTIIMTTTSFVSPSMLFGIYVKQIMNAKQRELISLEVQKILDKKPADIVYKQTEFSPKELAKLNKKNAELIASDNQIELWRFKDKEGCFNYAIKAKSSTLTENEIWNSVDKLSTKIC